MSLSAKPDKLLEKDIPIKMEECVEFYRTAGYPDPINNPFKKGVLRGSRMTYSTLGGIQPQPVDTIGWIDITKYRTLINVYADEKILDMSSKIRAELMADVAIINAILKESESENSEIGSSLPTKGSFVSDSKMKYIKRVKLRAQGGDDNIWSFYFSEGDEIGNALYIASKNKKKKVIEYLEKQISEKS